MAVPTSARDRVLVSFQTLTPEASSHVLRNRLERQKARAAASDARRAAKDAKEAKAKVRRSGVPEVLGLTPSKVALRAPRYWVLRRHFEAIVFPGATGCTSITVVDDK